MLLLTMLKGKIHRARVTEANVDYVGSITVDLDLLDASDILPYERVQVVDVDNGERLETYTIPGKRGSGCICLNGAAARKVNVGDEVIIMAYCQMENLEATQHQPHVVFVDKENKITETSRYEEYGVVHKNA